MHIAHVNLARGYRGGERQTELLVRSLATQDVRQSLIVRHGSPLAERLADVDVELRPCSPNLLAAFRATRGCDVVHSHEGRGVYAAWLRSLTSGTPYIVTRRVNNPIGAGRLTRNVYRRAAWVAAVAQDIANIVAEYDADIRSCVVHSSSSGLVVDPTAVRAIQRTFAGKWLVGNVAALDNAQKGQEYIIEVARQLHSSHPDIHFVLVGGGPDEQILREHASGLNNLSFTGFVDNVGDYLAAFDLFVLPSNREGIGGILLDAMDQSLPVIATRVGGLPEIVKDNDNGLLIDAGSAEQLQAAILRLYTDRDLGARLGARGHEFARDCTAAAMAGRYLSLYTDALDR
ncbi:MAG: glycosyltransferase family 4 protein [Gammaproteobacteria bacterium]|jgi:glycosyltransferase involved in cell wall biosynthesis|nr:glycosyltransferase family 4 protein [Gammaproteobacteria bacterium]